MMTPHETYTIIVRSEFDHTSHTIQYDSTHISSDHIIRDFIASHRRKHQSCSDDNDSNEHAICEGLDSYYVTCCAKVLRSGLFLDTDYRLLSQHTTRSPLHVQLHLSGALRGGKGGFGAQLRAQGTKVGQKKTTNFSGCRDLHGRRLRDVRDERRLRQWYVEQEQRERAEVERREQERRERFTEQRETVMTEHGNMIKKQTELVQSAVMSGLLQQHKKKKEEEENGKIVVVNDAKNNGDDIYKQDYYVSGSSSSSSGGASDSNGSNSSSSSRSSNRSSEKRKKDGADKKGKTRRKKKRKTSALFASEFDDDNDSDSDISESEL